jgi:hypothetical protein
MTQALPKKSTKVKTSAYDVAEHLRCPFVILAALLCNLFSKIFVYS